MEKISEIAIIGLFFGSLGTTIGGFLGSYLNITSNKLLCFILECAAGLMTAIICFDLIPKSLEFGNINLCLIGIIIGIIAMILSDNFIRTKLQHKKASNLLQTGLIVFLGLTIHNFPEGLAIGSGFESSEALGLSLAISIAIHDVPEGISIALPLKNGGVSVFKAIVLTFISGITTGLGALFGAIIANISQNFISLSLSFAAGAMLYIVACELIPESKSIYKGRFPSIGNILGIVLGIIAHSIIK